MGTTFKPGDKMRCINNTDQRHLLTVGKVYDCIIESWGSYVKVKTDNGKTIGFRASRFAPEKCETGDLRLLLQ